ncbi:aspartyl-phosphate phosphatase Spo0E family protein [Desulfoscipio sp. XC116]|uniref:aspartyl-phosphate phosphatase Spo0E family protein n=1 Tax=Desulfoscipio sp. XC116 TaxID=3144975 RepID=UPI00325AA8C5
MSREEIIAEIERLRARMYDLVDAGTNNDDLIMASQELDRYIVMYHMAANLDSYTIITPLIFHP